MEGKPETYNTREEATKAIIEYDNCRTDAITAETMYEIVEVVISPTEAQMEDSANQYF